MNADIKQASIAYILDNGLVQRETTWQKAKSIFQRLGVRFTFWDTAYSLIFAGITIAVIGLVVIFGPHEWRYSICFACAPAVFLVITALTETVERATNMYDLKQTCRYTIREVTALRVMCYCLVGMVVAMGSAGLASRHSDDFWRLLALTLCVLFASAAVEMALLTWVRARWAVAVAALVWILVSVGLPIAWSGWEDFLASVSIAVTCVVGLVSLGFAIWTFTRMLAERKAYALA